MMNHEEIKSNTNLNDKTKGMLFCIADYNEGWITEEQLEYRLTLILKRGAASDQLHNFKNK